MAAQNQLKAYRKGFLQGPAQGYSQIPQPGSPTYTEAWALIEAARRMAVAIESGRVDDIAHRNKVRESLRLNWRLWTIFQAELTVGESDVPDDIRQNMLSLCKFVDSHTIETMAKPTPEKIATLIDVNRNIASGLLASLENAAKQAAEAQTLEEQKKPASTKAPAAKKNELERAVNHEA